MDESPAPAATGADSRTGPGPGPIEDARRLASDVGWEPGHQATVCRLSLALFDDLTELHLLGEEARMLLACAANVHDIGLVAGPKGHHKSSAQMVLSSGIEGLDERQLDMAAAMARYHRKAAPDAKHKPYGSLSHTDRRTVRWCSALMRIADGLDRGHDDCVTGIDTVVSDTRLDVVVDIDGPSDLALWGANRKRALLEQESGRRVRVIEDR